MPCRKEGTTMKSKIIKLIINIHGNTVDAGGVNKSNGYVYNAYGNTTSTSGNDWTPEKATYYHKVFLKNLTAKCVHGQFGEHDTIPKQSGNIYNKRGISPYPTVTTPLQEGITPVGNKMSFYYVEIAVNQYGAYTPITDWASFCSRDDVMTKDSEELASQAGRSIEEIDREALNAGTSVIYAPAVGSDGTVTEVASRAAITPNSKLTIDTIFRALNYLECQNAEPIGENYVAVVHPNVKYDIISNKDFISVVKYAHAEKIFKGEIGTIGNVKFVQSNFAKVFKDAGASKIDVYSTLVFGKDAYVTVEIMGEGTQTIVKGFGSGGTADPLNQRATQGWKTTHGVGIIGQTRMVRIETASTLNTVAQTASPAVA